tara:strand:- start:223 stop:426 length:204 start_codon:yes stop_codon:yes gene_type:complete
MNLSKFERALDTLKVTNYACEGIPTSETEFNSMFKKIIFTNGVDERSSNPSDFGVTWSQVKAEMDKL